MRQEGIIRPAEAELQNLHAGQVEAFTQFDDIRRDDAQVLGDDRQRAVVRGAQFA